MKFHELLESHLATEVLRHAILRERKTVCDAPPNHIYVEPTNACVLNCAMCTPPELKGPKGFMSMEHWRKIIDSMADSGIVAPVTMIGRGEPLMHKSIAEFVEYASGKGIPCYIITNGVLLDDELATRLLNAGLAKIQFSIHAFSRETYRAVTSKDLYDRLVENILNIVERNKAMNAGCFIATMACESSLNKHEIDDFRNYWSTVVDKVFTTKLYSIQGNSRMAAEAEEPTGANHSSHPGCVMPWYFLGFRWNGNVTPCPYDFSERFVLGNIDDFSPLRFMGLWNCENMQELRRSHLEREFSFCTERGYRCPVCEVPRIENEFKAIDKYLSNFPTVFARQFGPLLKAAK